MITFQLPNESGDPVAYALQFPPQGSVELFQWRKKKGGTVPDPCQTTANAEMGVWEWKYTWTDIWHAGRRLLEMGMAGVTATSVEMLIDAFEEARLGVALAILAAKECDDD